MIRAEFYGPMGAGKSTLYSQLTRKQAKTCKWVSLSDKKGDLLWRHISTRSNLLGILFQIAIKNRRLKSQLTKSFQPLSLRSDLENHHAMFEPLVNYVLYSQRESQITPLIDLMNRYKWFFESVCDTAFLESQCEPDCRILFDEGLLQRGIAFSMMQTSPLDALSQYLRFMPLPNVAIYKTATMSTLYERISSRDGIDSRHSPFLEDAHKLAAYMTKLLKHKGVQVIEILPEETIEQAIQKCHSELP